MQKQVYFSLTLVAILLFACQPPVTFREPQPKDVAALNSFPKRIQGKYLNSEDSSFLQITENSIIRMYDFDQKIHLSQLDSNQQIIGDTLFDQNMNTGQLIQIEGDSIVMRVKEVDTLFNIDAQNVLKKFKGYYFVNILTPPDSWQVKKLEYSHGKLTLSSISSKDDLAQLKELTENTQDTGAYVFSLSRKQFKKFVREEGFRDSEEFWKIRN